MHIVPAKNLDMSSQYKRAFSDGKLKTYIKVVMSISLHIQHPVAKTRRTSQQCLLCGWQAEPTALEELSPSPFPLAQPLGFRIPFELYWSVWQQRRPVQNGNYPREDYTSCSEGQAEAVKHSSWGHSACQQSNPSYLLSAGLWGMRGTR